MSPTMAALLYLYILVVYTRLIAGATTTTTTTQRGYLKKVAAAATTNTTTTQPKEADDKKTVDNCDNARRPDSENLGMVFEKAANDTTLLASNPDVKELYSATSGSCAELCASRQTCVLYSISNTGTCRITSACRPQVESETDSVVMFLKYWG
ncbi:uncharacterized protein LOC124292162 [Haliotis rubra]|uniref:uncharacterized protein LOC124292162 n=1 Tax=Haliotis rubra TaxID=36100 RepID=UPI001EE59B48|nr:uncharacterized protein LOC124292162 [Haliotis rubra]